MAKIKLGNKVRIKIENNFKNRIVGKIVSKCTKFNEPSIYMVQWLDTRNIINQAWCTKKELEILNNE